MKNPMRQKIYERQKQKKNVNQIRGYNPNDLCTLQRLKHGSVATDEQPKYKRFK
jgi:hypothetical protein